MNKYPFCLIFLVFFSWKIGLNKVSKIVVFTLFLISCTRTEVTTILTGESTSILLPSPSAISVTPFFETPATTATSTPEIVLQPSPTQTPVPQPTSTTTPTLTPTPIILPELLIAAVEVKNKGEANEYREVWVIDTLTQAKNLVFTSTPKARLLQLVWAENQTDNLYISEIRGGDANEPVNWQLYEVNYNTGETNPFFLERVAGLPTLINLSFGGKWLCVWVNYFETFEWWFINMENGEVIKNLPQERYLDGFVWSPNESNTFAYYEAPAYDGNQITPQKVVISQLPDFETLDAIEYDGTWMQSPLLLWGTSNPEQLLFFSLDQIYQIDLNSKRWVQTAQGVDTFPGNHYTKIFQSFSGQWAITTMPIQIISLSNYPQVFDNFRLVNPYNDFLSWYNQEDWSIIGTNSGVEIYDLEHNFALLRKVRLPDYGFTAIEPYSAIAKPRN